MPSEVRYSNVRRYPRDVSGFGRSPASLATPPSGSAFPATGEDASRRRNLRTPPVSRISRSRGEYSDSSATSTPSVLARTSSSPSDGGQLPLLALLEPLVVVLVCEPQGDDTLGEKVAPVDAREALGDHHPDAEMQRGEGGVLPARALPVVVPAHYQAGRCPLRLFVVVGVEAAEGEFRDLGHF